ncbi:urea transporter [Paraburkholderia caledonica]|jgi:urea transporter|uniref:urea transporter n=1 Tax=Paraburkholderia caledonica TaxID=134536 RepID=UPI0038B881AA
MHAAATEAHSAALRTLLPSLGQIVLQANAFTGACLVAGWLLCDPRLACAALIGAGLHVLLGAGASSFDAGLLGFNGALTALALTGCGVLWMLGGVALSVALQAAAAHVGFAALSAPFVAATWSVQWLRQCAVR